MTPGEALQRAKPIIEEAMDLIKEEVGDSDAETIDMIKRAVCVGLANYREA